MPNGFREWCERVIGSTSPSAVRDYFGARGLHHSRQAWAKRLRPHLNQVALAHWLDICEVTGEPLGQFIDYRPSGGPRRALASQAPKNTGRPTTRRPRDYARAHDGPPVRLKRVRIGS